MIIGIDISVINLNQAGSAVYTSNLIEALRNLGSGNEFHIFDVGQTRNMSKNKTIISRLKTIYRDLIWTHAILPFQVYKAKIDVLHIPVNVTPLFSTCPTVLTILDTTVLQLPQYFTLWHRYYSRMFLPRSARNATIILTISENSKRDIVKQLKINSEKVLVTYLSASKEFKPISQQEVEMVKRRYNLDSFILTVGALEPRKNLSRLLQAFSFLLKNGYHHTLVHAGPRGWLFDNIHNEIRRLGLNEFVRFLGYVPTNDLVGLYNAASLFVYPSLYEGFGLPVLEAMACGCPVITSNTSSLPEVVGDAAIMVNPYDVPEMTNAIKSLLEDQLECQRLRLKGIERAKQFSWQKCAKETLNAYHLALKKHTSL
jgi:glycosyltransferase involved in cell wall biosynthesis